MTRVVTAVALGSVTIYIITWGPLFIGAAAVLAAILISAHEMAGLLESSGAEVSRPAGAAASCLTAAGAWTGEAAGLAAGLAAGIALLFAGTVLTGRVGGAAARLSSTGLLVLYPVWSLAHVVLYLDSGPGRNALLFLLFCVWVCDTAAYYTGSLIGRRALAPSISPNKTVAGAVAGTLGAAAVAVLLALSGLVPWPVLSALAAGFLIAGFAQLGDLAESMVKRDAGVKDSGSLIPGHGGMLDRVDSLLFTLPLFYYILSFAGGLQ